MSAESEGPGRGATFIIRIPLAAVSGERPNVRPPADVPVPATSLGGIRVLAVDDNIDALEIISLTLTSAGAIIRLAARGADAIREWAQSSADVLVCDLAMPDMSGFDVLKAIRADDAAKGRRSPAIALSAHASKAHLDECHAAGFDLHMAKPYKADELIAAIAGLAAREKKQ